MTEQLARQIAHSLSSSASFNNVRVEPHNGSFVVKADYPGFSFGESEGAKGTITILSAVDIPKAR